MSAKTVKKHTNVLSSQSLEEFQNSPIHTELKRQYSVRGLPGLLLSPRSRKGRLGYSTCSDCFYDLKYKKPTNTKPPKLSIANGFVIGAFPNKIKIASGPNKGMMRNIDVENEDQVSEIMRALVSPVRPYGYVIAYTGGKHQSIKGHYQFFEMNTEKINAGMHALSRNQCNVSVMLCGPMTTSQRTKIHRRAQIDSLGGALENWPNFQTPLLLMKLWDLLENMCVRVDLKFEQKIPSGSASSSSKTR
jgi:hypothetical protein